jgi:GNAT superfamily N-acetyltransferase
MLSPVSSTGNIQVRPLRADELGEADQVMRIAFGTFLGLPEPLSFMGDAAYVRPRWHQDPSAAFAAEVDGRLAGTNFAANWGSVGFFGPLSIRPDLWDRKIGQKLMEPVLDCFSRWGTRHAGLFTFSQSANVEGSFRGSKRPNFFAVVKSAASGSGICDSGLPPSDPFHLRRSGSEPRD